MVRYLGSIGLILILGGASVRADTGITPSVSGLTTTYTPGNTLTFEVGLTGATNLNSYNIALDLTSNKGTAGTDFYFLGSPGTYPPASGANSYVFDSGLGVSSPCGFVATADTVLSTNTALLNLSDFLDEGEFVSDSGSDTMLATVLLKTTPAAGNLALSFDGSVLELLTPEGQPVSGFGTLAANLNSFNLPAVAPVPEPGTLALLTVAGIIAAAGWRRKKGSWNVFFNRRSAKHVSTKRYRYGHPDCLDGHE